MATYLTADTHFGHPLVISDKIQARRPFASIQEHDETLVALWNAVVRPDDTVWHLGDFAHKCSERHALGIFRRLNGRKLLIRGNHDKVGERLPWAEPVRDVARIHLPDPAGGSQEIWLSHYAHRTWPAAHRGAIHLYGHSHGSLPGTATSTDVGVDCWDYGPTTLERIRERLTENALAEVEQGGDAS